MTLASLAAFSIQENYDSYFVRFKAEQVTILEPALDVVRVMTGIPRRARRPLRQRVSAEHHELDRRTLHRLRDRRPALVGPARRSAGAPVPFILDRPLLFFVHQSDLWRREQLKADFPQGEEKLMEQPFRDRNYYTYFVPR